jgi:SOS-response transcriptional repressor LexA
MRQRPPDADTNALDFIRWHWKELNCAPSYRAIMEAVGYKSTSSVHVMLMRLRQRGLITLGPKNKNVQVVNTGDPKSCDHDWRVSKIANPLLIQCSFCGHKTEVEYSPSADAPLTEFLKYTGYVG